MKGVVSTGYHTDASILDVFPAAATLTAAEIAETVQDITALYHQVAANPGISDADLRAWGEKQSIHPDRMTRALRLLQDSGKLFALPDPGPIAPPGPPAPPPPMIVKPSKAPAKPRARSGRKAPGRSRGA